MHKLLTYLVSILLGISIITSCSKDEPTIKFNVAPSQLILTHNETMKFEVTGETQGITYTSSNPYVASVDKNGLVTGGVKGKATIHISSGENSADISVELKTKVNDLIEPLCSLIGSSRGDVIKMLKPLGTVISKDNKLGIKIGHYLYIYHFDTNMRLKSVTICAESLTSQIHLREYLVERFVIIHQEDALTYGYINATQDYGGAVTMIHGVMYASIAKII